MTEWISSLQFEKGRKQNLLKLYDKNKFSLNLLTKAHNGVLLIKGIFHLTISELMESALGTLLEWASRKYKVPSFKRPRMDIITLELSKEPKCLYLKCWKSYEQKLSLLFICAKNLMETDGVWNHILSVYCCQYIRTYCGTLLWWKVMTHISILVKAQILFYLAITDAIKPSVQTNLEIILDILQFDRFQE